MAEWTANPLCSDCVGSNPLLVTINKIRWYFIDLKAGNLGERQDSMLKQSLRTILQLGLESRSIGLVDNSS